MRFTKASPAILIYRQTGSDVEAVRIAHEKQDFAELFDRPE
jgi:plasmid stabilization system protein ParE